MKHKLILVRAFLRLPLKLRLYLPILLGIIISIVIVTVISIYTYNNATEKTIEANMVLQTQTINKMLEREYALKKETVETNIRVAHEIFYSKPLEIKPTVFIASLTNQFTQQQHAHYLHTWLWNNKELTNNTDFIDYTSNIIGGTVTVFQRIDSGYVRIATNVTTANNIRAVGTFIPNNSPVAQSVSTGKPL